MTPVHRTVTLDGLGFMSNPAVFRIYVSLACGALLYGYTILMVSGHWLFVLMAFFTMTSMVKAVRRVRIYHLPQSATLDGPNLLGGALVATAAAGAFFAIVDDFTFTMAIRIVGAATASGFALLLAVVVGEGRSWRTPLRPKPLTSPGVHDAIEGNGLSSDETPTGQGW